MPWYCSAIKVAVDLAQQRCFSRPGGWQQQRRLFQTQSA
jgi:hypothetical protein